MNARIRDVGTAERHEAGTTRLIVRATVLTGVLTGLGALLGLLRDLLLARYFGATGDTDAFIVAWTVPETASPLLIEGAMGFLMVPIFVRALNDHHSLTPVVRETLPKIAAVLAVAAATIALAAPALVGVLAPGLAEPDLAVLCTRITAVTVFMFGITGYLAAALRSTHAFGVQASIYIAYNVGILAAIMMLRVPLGVTSAAVGVAAGSVLMVLVQLPSFARRLRPGNGGSSVRAGVALGAFVPIAAFTLTRQAQVFVERFLGSELGAGAISHLNYAQKVAQVPMALSIMVATVTYPMLARSVATGDDTGTRERTEWDLRVVSAVVLVAAAYVIAYAEPIITLLFQHGAFTAADTAATASIMRVYAFGLLGQAAVGTLGRSYFSDARPAWYPAMVMGLGLALTALIGALLLPVWHADAIAAGNAAGITVTAVLMFTGLRRRPGAVVSRVIAAAVARLVAVATAAGVIGFAACELTDRMPALFTLAIGAVVVTTAFIVLGRLAGVPEVRLLGSLAGRTRNV
jgi:putative peptidoglycan lipid II flippase